MRSKQTVEKAYVVNVNADLTEGRGPIYPKYVCREKATAIRLASGADVQGHDAKVTSVKIRRVDNQWLGPIRLLLPTAEDKIEQKRLDDVKVKQQVASIVAAKAKAAGLTDEDIAILKAS